MRLCQRLAQATIAGISERRGARKLRQCVILDLDEIVKIHQSGAGGIYIRVNSSAHRMRYVGQTVSFKDRDEQHLRTECAAQRDKNLVSDEQHAVYYMFVAKHGYAGSWIDMPMAVIPRSTVTADRLRLEKWYIRQYGTLNTAGGVFRFRPNKKHSRRRPVRRLRGQVEERRQQVTTTAPVRYVDAMTGATCIDFCRALEQSKNDSTWTVQEGTFDVSRSKSVQREFGHTTLRCKYVDGFILGGLAKDMIRQPNQCKKYGLENIVEITVANVQRRPRCRIQLDMRQLIKKLGRSTGPRIRKVLRGMVYRDIRRAWGAAGDERHELRRKNARININNHARRVWGISMSAKTTVKVESTERHVMQAAVCGAEMLLRHTSAPLELKRDMVEKLKVVRVRPKTIASSLTNWRKEHRSFDAEADPESL